MASLPFLLCLLAGIALVLPNGIPVRNVKGNPYDLKCNLDSCLAEVIAEGHLPAETLKHCASFPSTMVFPTSTHTSILTATAVQTPVTITVFGALPI